MNKDLSDVQGSNRMRLQKYMSLKNICSRREAEKWILAGFVTVNGEVVKQLGLKIDAKLDTIQILKPKTQHLYKAYHKPKGVLTHKNFKEDTSIIDFFENKDSLKPIGRLDKESEGLILLTTDTVLRKKCLDPNLRFEKIYDVELNLPLTANHILQLRKGVKLKGEALLPMYVSPKKQNNWYQFKLTQGKNRQIRKVMSKFRREVLTLKRIAYAKIKLNQLKPNESLDFNPKHLF